MKKNNHDSRTRFLATSMIVLLFTLLNSCSKSNGYTTPSTSPGGTTGPPASEVWIQGMAFDPGTITVTVNTAVKWTNMDSMAHTVTSDTGLFESGNMNTGGTYSFTFTTKGTFSYHCSIHPGMTATVVVQ